MQRKSLSGAIACLFAFSILGSVLAQDSKTLYTQVGFWDVSRDKWSAYVDYVTTYEKPVMERLLAEGLIVEWGFDSNGLHDPDDYTHGTWMSAYSIANLEKATQAYYQSVGNDADRLEAELAGMIIKHKDILAYSENYGMNSSSMEGGYSVGSFVQVQPGKGAEFRRAYESWVKPVYEKLLAEGTIVSYSMGSEYYHTETPGGMWTWHIVRNAEDLEKVDAAFEAGWENLSPADRDARWDHRRDVTVEGSHRDAFTRIIYYQTK